MNRPKESITQASRRRFILGRQGLWPGRRWRGKAGAAQAIRACEAVQVDPVAVVAQSHDIVLWGRVLGYEPAHLHELAYEDRQFFDYGGSLFIYPMEELPYRRFKMERRKNDQRWAEFAKENQPLIDEVKEALKERGPLRSRDLDGKKVVHYRSGKESGVALYHLWLTGELMTHHRHGRERVYDFLEKIAPPDLRHMIADEEAEAYLIRKAVAQRGLIDARTFRTSWQSIREIPVDLTEAQLLIDTMIESGELAAIQIEGNKEPYFCLSEDVPLLEQLAQGEIPPGWQPLESSTEEEVVFLSPLEYVSARRRALKLFDFDFVWEIYKPAKQRQYGPYTMPVLYGDRLVARMDARHERSSKTLIINGLWLEEWFQADDRFASALAKGLARFCNFLGAKHLDTGAVEPEFLRNLIDRRID